MAIIEKDQYKPIKIHSNFDMQGTLIGHQAIKNARRLQKARARFLAKHNQIPPSKYLAAQAKIAKTINADKTEKTGTIQPTAKEYSSVPQEVAIAIAITKSLKS